MIESGGKYLLSHSQLSNDDTMDYGVIICQVGARYASYCSNIGRTFFVNPTKEKQEKYAIILSAHTAAIKAMVDGAKASDVYTNAVSVLRVRIWNIKYVCPVKLARLEF